VDLVILQTSYLSYFEYLYLYLLRFEIYHNIFRRTTTNNSKSMEKRASYSLHFMDTYPGQVDTKHNLQTNYMSLFSFPKQGYPFRLYSSDNINYFISLTRGYNILQFHCTPLSCVSTFEGTHKVFWVCLKSVLG